MMKICQDESPGELRRFANPEVPEEVWIGFEEAEDGRGIEIRDEHFEHPPSLNR